MGASSISPELLADSRVQASFRGVRRLVGYYFLLSLLTLGVVILLRDHSSLVNDAVWTRSVIVVASALLTWIFARRAARGSRKGFLQVRLVSAIMLVAIVVIISLPGTFPTWMRAEQAVCGLLLLGVVIKINSKHVRRLFAAS
ncbi:hypothetical protein ACFV3R_09590 [Streptomyces sp. NPDC059740]|uniref:hypothetical protein n=1 Tax=Streptomyces sp. NPDC059740 TaxID=3346926 RepID=UPI00364D9BF4